MLSGADSLSAAALDAGKAFGFLLLLAVVARWGTRIIGRLIATKDNELLVISFLGAAVLSPGSPNGSGSPTPSARSWSG